MRRLVRLPLLHFLAGGAALFVVVHGTAARRETPPAPVVIAADDVARLRRDLAREIGREPSPADEVGLVERAVEDELLFREALARGLDQDRSVRNWLIEQMRVLEPDTTLTDEQLHDRARGLGLDRTDLVVHRMLVQKMRLLAARTGEHAPSDDELRAFYAAHAAEYRTPERVTLWQVFLSGASLERAGALLAELRRRRGRHPPRGCDAAIPSRRPPICGTRRRADLARRFGPGFPEAVATAPARTWTGPVARPTACTWSGSSARIPGEAPALDDLRGRCGSAGSTSSARAGSPTRCARFANARPSTSSRPHGTIGDARDASVAARDRPRDHARRVCRARPWPRSGHAVAACGGRRHVRGDVANRRCTPARQ